MHSSRMLIMSCLNSFKEKLSGDYKTLLKAHGFQIYNHPKLPKSTHPIKFLQRCQPKTENQFSNHRNPMEIPWKPKKNTHPSSPRCYLKALCRHGGAAPRVHIGTRLEVRRTGPCRSSTSSAGRRSREISWNPTWTWNSSIDVSYNLSIDIIYVSYK